MHAVSLLSIGTGLQQSKALIAVITTKYLNSKFCTNELYAASSDQKAIFPIILENIDFSASERSRGVKYVIGSINWTMFGTGYDYNSSLEHLVQGMTQQGLGEEASLSFSIFVCFKSTFLNRTYNVFQILFNWSGRRETP